jgi:hypothetical protein
MRRSQQDCEDLSEDAPKWLGAGIGEQPLAVGSHHKIIATGRLPVIAYRAILDVPRAVAQYVDRLLLAERRALGRRGQQGVDVLAAG